MPRTRADEAQLDLVDSVLYRGISTAYGLRPAYAQLNATTDQVYEHAGYLTGKGKIEYRDGRVFTGAFFAGEPKDDGEHLLEIPNANDAKHCDRYALTPSQGLPATHVGFDVDSSPSLKPTPMTTIATRAACAGTLADCHHKAGQMAMGSFAPTMVTATSASGNMANSTDEER